MPERTWRQRLAEAVERDGRSARAISKDAATRSGDVDCEAVGDAYVWELLNTTKEPSIGRLLAVCEALRVSISYILEGIELTPQSERLLKAFGRMPKDRQESFLQFLEKEPRR